MLFYSSDTISQFTHKLMLVPSLSSRLNSIMIPFMKLERLLTSFYQLLYQQLGWKKCHESERKFIITSCPMFAKCLAVKKDHWSVKYNNILLTIYFLKQGFFWVRSDFLFVRHARQWLSMFSQDVILFQNYHGSYDMLLLIQLLCEACSK